MRCALRHNSHARRTVIDSIHKLRHYHKIVALKQLIFDPVSYQPSKTTMLSLSSNARSRRRRSAALSPMALSPAALLLLRGVSGSNATNTIIDSPAPEQYRIFPVKFVANPPRSPLDECEGDCDNNDQCADGLTCYQRDKNEEVPGCTGGGSDTSLTDYCIRPAGPTAAPTIALATPTPQPTVTIIQSPTPLNTTAAPTTTTPLPTPLPTTAPTANPVQTQQGQKEIKFVDNPPKKPLAECEGDCDNDDECAGDLVCHQRDPFGSVPGCTGGESSGNYRDYCINDSTASPTTSASPTHAPTMSSVPTVSPAPSVQPSLNPTPAPNSVSERFKLRLYWSPNYYWQETRKETFWCWQCRGGCKVNNLIEIDHCSKADYFQYYGEDSSYRPHSNPELCVTEDGFDKESRPLRLKKCDGGIKQKWDNSGDVGFNFDKSKPWEIHPESKMDQCVTQMHHPKAHERVFIRSCQKPRINTTSKWVTYG